MVLFPCTHDTIKAIAFQVQVRYTIHGLKTLCWLIWPRPSVVLAFPDTQRETANAPACRSVTRLLMRALEIVPRPARKTASIQNVRISQVFHRHMQDCLQFIIGVSSVECDRYLVMVP